MDYLFSTMKNCTNRFRSIRLDQLCAFILLLSLAAAVYADLSPTEFVARYEVNRSDQHVADAVLKLSHEANRWIWRIDTRPHGFYQWLTRKKPFTETLMIETEQGLRMSQLSSGDYSDKPPIENTWFDNEGKTIYFTSEEKERVQRQLPMPDSVYAYYSVHLLYPLMKQSEEDQKTIEFYDQGRLFKSTLTLETGINLEHRGHDYKVDRLTQSLDSPDKKMVYYFLDHDLAPVLIERHRKNQLKTLMWRTSLEIQ